MNYAIADLLKQEGLDWKVESTPMYYIDKDGCQPKVPAHKAILRSDTQRVLGVVGSEYQEVDNATAFAPFDAAIKDSGGSLKVERVLEFKGGKRVAIQVRLPKVIRVAGTDISHSYALICTSHDGSTGINGLTTAVRVSCENTLNLALRSHNGNKVSVRHSTNALSNLRRINNFFADAIDTAGVYEQVAQILARKQANNSIVQTFLNDIGMKVTDEKKQVRTINNREAILNKFQYGRGNTDPKIKGSMWTLLNGLTEWVDHQRSTRGANNAERTASREFGKLYGSGALLKQKALASVVELAR